MYSVAGNVSENKLYFCSEIVKKRKPLNSFYISCSGVLLPTVTSLYTYIYSYQKDFRFYRGNHFLLSVDFIHSSVSKQLKSPIIFKNDSNNKCNTHQVL